MLSRAAARRQALVLFDFLAPSLIARPYISGVPSNKKSYSSPSQPSVSPQVFHDLKNKIKQVHSTHGHNISDSHANFFNKTVVNIRKAVERRDVNATKQYWKDLDDKKLVQFLGQPQLDSISSFLVKTCLGQGETVWDAQTRKLVENVALSAAAGRSTDALNACMFYYIRQNDPESVVDLYKRFMTLVGDAEKKSLDEHEDKAEEDNYLDNSLLAIPSNTKLHTTYPPGRVSILLAVITAHAMQGTFSAALQDSLATVVMFHHFTTQEYIKKLGHDQSLQQKVQLYIDRLKVAKAVARPPFLSKQIASLSRQSSLANLRRLYEGVINGLSGPDAYIAAEPSATTPTKVISLTEFGWTGFLVAFLKHNHKELSARVWNDMAQFGIQPGAPTWTALLDAHNEMGNVSEAVASWHAMLTQGIRPQALTYRAIISALFNACKPLDAMRYFQEFRKDVSIQCSESEALAIYNTVLRGLLNNEHPEEAKVVMRSMDIKGPAPDLISFNTFLAYYGRCKDFKALAALIEKMEVSGLKGDVFTFSTILSALLKVGRRDAPDMILGIMRRQNIQPNVATFTSIIDFQMREENEENLQAALRLLYQMEREPGLQPNDVTYTSILASLHRSRWLPDAKMEEIQADIVSRMRKRGIKFNVPIYHILIKACLDNASPEGLQGALGYYQEMVKQKMSIAHATWYLLLAGLIQRQEWDIADEIVNDMFLSGFKPGGTLLKLAGKIRKRIV